MMMALDVNAALLQLVSHLAAKVYQRVERRQRHITFLVANVIPEIRGATLSVRVPDRFGTIDRKPGRLSFILKTHIAEHKELGFRTKIDRVGEPRGFKMTLGATCDAARIQ